MAYVDEVLADSPLLYWRLDEVSGTAVADLSGNGRLGTAVGSPVMGEPGGLIGDASTSFKLTGNSVRVEAPYDPAYGYTHAGQLTVELLFKKDVAFAIGDPIMLATFMRGPITGWTNWAIRATSTHVTITQQGSPATWEVEVSVVDGNWHHIVLELDKTNNERRLYVGGVLRGSDNSILGGAYTSTDNKLWLGDVGTNTPAVRGWVDEFAIYDTLLGPDRIAAHWWAARAGNVAAQAIDISAVVPPAHVSVGQWIPATAIDISAQVGLHALSEPLRPKSVSDPDDVPGPIGQPIAGAIYPASAISESIVPGIRIAPPVEQTQPLRPASVSSLSIVPGPWMPVSFVPTPGQPEPDVPIWVPVPPSPTYPTGQMLIEGRMMVSGTSRLLQAECTPTLNGVGSGTFTDHSSSIPAPGDSVTFSVAGKTVMTGSVGEVEDAEVSPDEEHGEVQRVSVRATAQELNDVLVLPEWGAMDVERLGPPIADTRVFDWTANGLGDWSGDGALYTPGATPVPQMLSVGVDILAADTPLGGPWNSAFPLPDVWPDNQSQWMNWISPRIPAPEGWALFRVATPPPPPGHSVVQFWLCAWDYAELWCDGVKLVTCDTPGKAEHIEITGMGDDYHLLAIRLYTTGGAAGVMCTMLPVRWDRLYGPPIMNSRSGWVTLPVHDAFIYTPGAVLNRLFYEARERGNNIAKNWTLTFSNKSDSAGRPWPVPDWPIELDVGMSMLEVLNRLSETYIDWRERPGGHAIDAFVKGEGSGRSVNVPWTAGVDLDSRERTRAERE